MVKFSHEDFINKFYSFGKNNNYEVVSEYTRMLDKIKVKHKKCGHVFTRMAVKTTPKVNCPRCHKQSRNKRTDKMYKEEVKELVGDEYVSLEKYINTDTKTLMRHEVCGYEWSIQPNSFLNAGVRCPNCAKGGIKRDNKWFINKLKKVEDYEEDYLFLEEYIKYDRKIKIKHLVCGRTYKVSPNKFLLGRRCPLCNESRGESKIDFILRSKEIVYEREVMFKGMRNKKPLKCDFYIKDKRYKSFVIEFDGEQHFKTTRRDNWSKERFKYISKLDKIKNNYMAEKGIPIYRVPYWEIDNLDKIIKEILQENLQRLSKATPYGLKYRVNK